MAEFAHGVKALNNISYTYAVHNKDPGILAYTHRIYRSRPLHSCTLQHRMTEILLVLLLRPADPALVADVATHAVHLVVSLVVCEIH